MSLRHEARKGEGDEVGYHKTEYIYSLYVSAIIRMQYEEVSHTISLTTAEPFAL